MKTRESGMPSEEMWETFFSPADTLQALGMRSDMEHVVELGCGYGTFTIPSAQITSGTVHSFDIEQSMIEETRHKAEAAGCLNINLSSRDFVADGTGLADSFADYVMLFNLLHAEHPEQLTQESFRILKSGGLLAIMHWNYDPETPRGPSMDIRPKPEDCVRWTEAAGFSIVTAHIDLPPYHYGIIAQKK
ncbi:class I SAM-dependent methyltransferase [Verrucomicrobiota bacterium]